MVTRRTVLLGTGALALSSVTRLSAQTAGQSLTVTTTASLNSSNPYAHSTFDLYTIWRNIYGTLGRFDREQKRFVGVLADSWERQDDTRWRFKLRGDLRRHDGGPSISSKDVLHSWQRSTTDKSSLQGFYYTEIDRLEPVDELTFDAITKRPFAQLLSSFFSNTVVTSADLYEQHGVDADQKAPYGWGPYQLERFDSDSQVVLRRSPGWPDALPHSPEAAVFRQIQEAEQRVTAVLNDEVQIARQIDPQLIDRFKGRDDVRITKTAALQKIFLGFNVKHKPWDDVRLRRAVAHAVNRDLIIERLFFGEAEKTVGTLLPDQECYAPASAPLVYDPDKARALIAEAGFANGIEVDLYTPSGRYVLDRQVGEAVVQMLGEVGIKVNLHTPEYASLFSDIAKGKLPFYYLGRSVGYEPLADLSQYFETGVTVRTSYSNPELDNKFARIRATFDDNERCNLVHQLNDALTQDVPALFLWAHNSIVAVRSNVQWTPDGSADVWLPEIVIT